MSASAILGSEAGSPAAVSVTDGIVSSAASSLKAIRYPNKLQDIAVVGKVKAWQRSFLLRPVYGGEYVLLMYPQDHISVDTILWQTVNVAGFNGAPSLVELTVPPTLQLYKKWVWRLVRLSISSKEEREFEVSDLVNELNAEPFLQGDDADYLAQAAFNESRMSYFIYECKASAEGCLSFDEETNGSVARTIAWSCHQPYVAEGGKAIVWEHANPILHWYRKVVEDFDPHRVWALGDTSYSDGISETNFVKQVFDHEGWHKDNQKRQDLLALYRLNYRYHWSFSDMQSVMRNYPHLAMWDDHEIRDGYGSDETHFKEENKVMKDIASQAAQEYLFQWSPVVQSASKHSFETDNHQSYISGPLASFIFDGRNSRNYGEDLAIPTEVSQTIAFIADQIAAYYGGLPVKVIQFTTVSFGSIARKLTNLYRWKNAGQVISDQQLNDFKQYCGVVKNNPNVKYLVMGNSVPFIFVMDVIEALLAEAKISDTALLGELRDDIRDSWHSPANRRQLNQVIDIMRELHEQRPDIEFINVSGDIHISNAFTYQPKGFKKPLYQVTSSAITNRTTGDLGSDLISTGGPLSIGSKQSEDFGKVNRLWHEGEYQNFLTMDATPEAIKLRLHVYNHDDGTLGARDRVLTIRPSGGYTMEGPEGGIIDNAGS